MHTCAQVFVHEHARAHKQNVLLPSTITSQKSETPVNPGMILMQAAVDSGSRRTHKTGKDNLTNYSQNWCLGTGKEEEVVGGGGGGGVRREGDFCWSHRPSLLHWDRSWQTNCWKGEGEKGVGVGRGEERGWGWTRGWAGEGGEGGGGWVISFLQNLIFFGEEKEQTCPFHSYLKCTHCGVNSPWVNSGTGVCVPQCTTCSFVLWVNLLVNSRLEHSHSMGLRSRLIADVCLNRHLVNAQCRIYFQMHKLLNDT